MQSTHEFVYKALHYLREPETLKCVNLWYMLFMYVLLCVSNSCLSWKCYSAVLIGETNDISDIPQSLIGW